MVLVFFIFTFIIITLLVILFSTIQFKLEKVYISNLNKDKKLIYDYEIHIELLFLNKIKIFSQKVDKNVVERINTKLKLKNKLQNMKLKKIKSSLPKKEEIKLLLNKLDINFEKINFNMEIGTEDVIITTLIVTTIASILGIFFARIIKKYDDKKYKYKIYPIYENSNLIKLNLNCIIKLKVVHIIYVIYLLVRKRRVNKNERTSNRRSYDYSYE